MPIITEKGLRGWRVGTGEKGAHEVKFHCYQHPSRLRGLFGSDIFSVP